MRGHDASGERRYTVAIAGGGQLARMMMQAAIPLGVDVRLLAEEPGVSAAQVVPETTVGDYRDLATLTRFVDGADALTFDHEHVPTRHLEELARLVAVRPGPSALVYAQDKALMREKMSALGVACPSFAICDTPEQVAEFGDATGWPIIAKTSRGGYDGKGVWRLDQAAQAGVPFEGLAASSAGEPVRIVAEELIDFSRELSAIVVRSPSGQVVAYPISETRQDDGICVETITPAPGLDDQTACGLQEMAVGIATELGVVGVLAVELMQSRDGRIVVNELAMRPHNTGHWSIDGALTSQFENHLRAVLDLPLGSPSMRDDVVVMANVLGGSEKDLTGALLHVFARDREVRVHLYGKEVKPGRKVGHVTCGGVDVASVRRRAWHAANYLMGNDDA